MSSIVFLSHTTRAASFRVGSHHLSSALSAQGHQVAHISTPFSALHRIRNRSQVERRHEADCGAHETEGGVIDLVPRPLLPADVLWTRRQTQRVLLQVGIRSPEFVFVDQPLFHPEHFTDSTVVFRPTDLFPDGRMTRRALTVAQQSHGIAATSPRVLDVYGPACPGPGIVIENGVEFERFRQASGAKPEYDFVYLGALDHRFDFAALAAAAAVLPDASFAVFGPVPAHAPSMPTNVEFRGPVSYEMAPSVLARARWGIMPFVASPLNAGRSPMKFYEYIAAGLPVIAPADIVVRAPGLRSVMGYDPSDPDGFPEAAREAYRMGSGGVTSDDLEAAAARDWSVIAKDLLRFAETAGSTGGCNTGLLKRL